MSSAALYTLHTLLTYLLTLEPARGRVNVVIACTGVTVAGGLSSSLERRLLHAGQPRPARRRARPHAVAVRLRHGSVVPASFVLGDAAGRARQRGRRRAVADGRRRRRRVATQQLQLDDRRHAERQRRRRVVGRHARLPGPDDRRPGRRQDGAHAAVHDLRVHGCAEHQLRSVDLLTTVR